MKITHTTKVKASEAIKSSTYIYEFGIDDGDAESGPLVHDNKYDFEATSLEEAQRMGDEMFSNEEGFVGGHAREATQEELDEIAKWNEIEDHYIFDDGNVYPKDDVESATQEEMQQAFEAYQKKQAELGKQLDDLQENQLKRFNRASNKKPERRGFFKRAFGAEDMPKCHKVSENEDSIEYIVSSEDIKASKWMGKYLRQDGSVKQVYFDCNTDDWNEAVSQFEDIIPEPYQSAKLLGKAPDNIASDDSFTYIQCASKKVTPEVLNEIESKVYNKVHRWLVDVQHFDEEADPNDIANVPADDIFVVDVREEHENIVVVEVRAELSYDSMETLADLLEEVIRQYDSDAYFEQVDPGIMEAYLVFYQSAEASEAIEAASPVSDTREHYLEPDDKDYYEEIDEFEQWEDVAIDADITIEDDGTYDYDSYDFAKDYTTSGDYQVRYDDLGESIELRDYMTVVEDIDLILANILPDVTGKHHITGTAHLCYKVNGLVRNKDDGLVYDYDMDVNFNPDQSYIDNFKID